MRATSLILVAALATCADAPTEPASSFTVPEPSAETLRPGPAARRGERALALQRDCVSCHAAEAAAWTGSRHHHANTNLAYRDAFIREGSPMFCTSCHAPEAADPKAPTPAESELGVGCVSCHVVEGTVLSAHPADAPRRAPHPVKRSADFAATGGCVGCHEFRFPGLTGHDPQAFMQTTVGELAAATPHGRCASCHMPDGDHGFAQVRDPAWLAAGLNVGAQRVDDAVVIELSLPAPSHAYPTGDLFRRLQVGVEWRDAAGQVVERQVRYLARHFEEHDDFHHGRLLTRDDRVHLGSRRLRFDAAPDSVATSRRWWVTLQRVATVGRGHDPEAATIESAQPILDGEL